MRPWEFCVPIDQKRIIIAKFFKDFVKPVIPFFRELTYKYKEYGEYPVFPTFIAEYYTDKRDKEVALFSTLCMDWRNGDVYEQVQSMRELMGDSPHEWFQRRLFVTISVGRVQNDKLGNGGAKYWQIARLFDRLYHLCKEKNTFELGRVFHSRGKAKRSRMELFAEDVCTAIEFDKRWEFKINVIELVFRATDGLGMGIWKGCKTGEKCPRNIEIHNFVKIWLNEYTKKWDFEDTIRMFGLDNDADFFYLYLAWAKLSRKRPKECSRFATVFYDRFDRREALPVYRWRKFFPTIEF